MSNTGYRDEETLRELYVDRELSQREIGERFRVDQATISSWVSRYGITRSKPYTDAETLREEFHENGLTQQEIADKYGVAHQTISNWMVKHGINPGIESTQFKHSPGATYITHKDGYEYVHAWSAELGKMEAVRFHRLLAVAEFGFDAVKGMDVHHRNGIPWDNRPENLELLKKSEHSRHHALLRETERDSIGRFVRK